MIGAIHFVETFEKFEHSHVVAGAYEHVDLKVLALRSEHRFLEFMERFLALLRL